MTIRERWRKTTVANQAVVFTSVLVAFGTVFYAVSAACQVSIMKQASTDSAAQVERLTSALGGHFKTGQ
jgi:multisubunit Na+/H+ antiporter MnhC subunit